MLAIAAARLGYSPVLAVDVEPGALEASAENARSNGAEVEVRRRQPAARARSVGADRDGEPRAPAAARRRAALERAPRALIASGLLREEADEVVAAFAAHGLQERDRRFGGEWAAVLLAR